MADLNVLKFLLNQKIEKYEKLLEETDSLFSNIAKSVDSELSEHISQYEKYLKRGDTAAFLIGVASGLFKLVKKGYQSGKLIGDELEALNKETLKSLGVDTIGKAQNITGMAKNDTPENIALDFLLNFTSPSYWFRCFGKSPEQMCLIKKVIVAEVYNIKRLSKVKIEIRIKDLKEKLKYVKGGVDITSLA